MTEAERVIEFACIELDMWHGEKEWHPGWKRLIELARIGASVMPRPIVLDDLRLWNSDVTLTNGELKLQFDNAQDADKMCDFLLALAEIKHALPKPQVTP